MIKRPLTFYVDMDGVTHDFMSAIENLFGKSMSGLSTYDMSKQLGIPNHRIWRAVDEAGIDFWVNMEPYPWKDQLIKACFALTDEVYISTSPSQHPSSTMGKHTTILRDFPKQLHRRFFIGPQKQQLARDENTVLIDDSDKKCEKFEAAGGRAILFPRTWNKNRQYADDPMKYVLAKLRPDPQKIHILILEDDPTRMLAFEKRFRESELAEFTFDHVDNVHNAKKLLKENQYDMLFLDHDLGGEIYVDVANENTGSELARWLAANKADVKLSGAILIHSFNPQGAEYMRRTLDPVYGQVVKTPALWADNMFKAIIS